GGEQGAGGELRGGVGEAGQGGQGDVVDVHLVAVAADGVAAPDAVGLQDHEVRLGAHHPHPVGGQAVPGVPVADLVLLARHGVPLDLGLCGQVAPAAEAGAAGRVGEGGGQRRVRVGGRPGQRVQVTVVEAGVHAAPDELLVPQGSHEEVPVGDGAVDHRPFQGR